MTTPFETYATRASALAIKNSLDSVGEENNERALKWLQNRTQVIEFDGGIIISRF